MECKKLLVCPLRDEEKGDDLEDGGIFTWATLHFSWEFCNRLFSIKLFHIRILID